VRSYRRKKIRAGAFLRFHRSIDASEVVKKN
jgi:hypothetical protein